MQWGKCIKKITDLKYYYLQYCNVPAVYVHNLDIYLPPVLMYRLNTYNLPLHKVN